MLFRIFFVAAFAACLVVSAPARSALIGDASVPYSASRTVTVNGKAYDGKVFHIPGKQRHDVDIHGIPVSFILDVTRGTGAIVLPALNSYIDFPLPPLLAEFDRRRLDRKAVGEERIAGRQATKYRLSYTASDGARAEGFIWLSRDNILLRLSGRILRPRHKPMLVSMSLSDLHIGPQDPELFRIGKGLRKIPYQALDLLLNLHEHKGRADSP